MNQVKVSIIIPIYNVEEYLEECLVSAVNQTLKEIEIICVNDGTPDNSMDIVKKYAENDDRIVIVNKENGGLSSARNAGLEVAKGEYIYFLDSDDYILAESMEILYKEAREYNLDNIYFDAESFFETEELKEEMIRYMTYYERTTDYSEVVSGLEILNRMEKNNEFRPSACLQMPRREFLLENHIRFYEGIIHEDNLFSLECVLEEQRVKHIPNKLYMRRMREGSIMTDVKEFKSSFGYYMCLEGILERIKGRAYSDEFKGTIGHRLYAIQTSAMNKIVNIPENEIEEFIKEMPIERQLMYRLMVKRVAEEKKRSSNQVKALNVRIKRIEKELQNIKKSTSYKVGRALLVLPIAVKKILKKIKKKGTKYTLFWIKSKLDKKSVYVSIIVPVYNAGANLRACLETIEKQTLKNIEVICVNDGSEDGSLKLLREFEKKDSRFHVIDKENTGAGDCRNVGMREAKGEYLLFLDADDMFDKNLCDKAYYQAKTDKADICFFGSVRYNMQLKKKEAMNWVLRKELLPENRPFQKKDLGDRFFQMTSGCPWSKLFRREFVQKHNLEFMSLQNANDLFFVRTAMALAENMTYVNEPLVIYRFAGGANTQSNKHKAPLEFYKAYKALKARLEKDGVYEEVEQSFVNLVFDDCVFNYRTTGTPEAKSLIGKTLMEEGFEYFGFDKYPEEFYYNNYAYQEYQKIIEAKYE